MTLVTHSASVTLVLERNGTMAIEDNYKLMPNGEVIAEMPLNSVGTFMLTPERIRNCALQNHVISGPGNDMRYMPSTAEMTTINRMIKYAVGRGQVIDFGHWPNDMIREVGHRGGNLYCQGALGHPFSTPYIFVHTWNDSLLPSTMETIGCAYLVNPFSEGKELCIDFEAMTLEGLQIPRDSNEQYLGVGDRISLDASASKEHGFYACQVVPFAKRWPNLIDNDEFQRFATNRNGDDMDIAAAGNVADPIMVALMLLNTRGVVQETISFDKLNKIRARSNKPLYPPYNKVKSSNYVTAIMNRFKRSPGPGTGTHASPIMHVRKGHWRNYKTGEHSFIRDTLVNADKETKQNFMSTRSHYTVKE